MDGSLPIDCVRRSHKVSTNTSNEVNQHSKKSACLETSEFLIL